jgi:hypothetical protein
MAISSILGSVGRAGQNFAPDVRTVQELINRRLPIPLRPLDVDGVCGSATIAAIVEIQSRFLHMKLPDGLVNPKGRTFRFLATGSDRAEARFSDEVIAAARSAQKAWKIPASVTLAQWALESAYGKQMPPASNNPFGIKAAAGQAFVEVPTREFIDGKWIVEKAKFRKFESLAAAFDEHGKLLATADPYEDARAVLPDPDAFADELTGVYATDPDYGKLLKSIMRSNNLYQYN